MQPYFLPYIGYFQLINAVDKFVLYDDVNFINKGWINRNQMLVNHQKFMFTIPLANASQNRKINEVGLSPEKNWRQKMAKTIEQAYKKAPFYQDVMPVIADILDFESDNIAAYNFNQLSRICSYMGIPTELVSSSAIYQNQNLKGQERIVDICLKENAHTYINPVGGMEIYDSEHFENQNIELCFIQSLPAPYTQFTSTFIPWLSTLDLLMHVGRDMFPHYLNQYTLIKKEKI